ncbi:MAG TPA: hypothetical protein VK774_09030 [Solirubrobacteraceae bacterium]|nr:hypothetical protein [Solirubrobacteraceae bacterium]
MYHLELRKFPHTACRFNQSEEQLRAIVVPWARQEWIEEGERNWNVNEAKLTVLEGPELSMPELAMGKGWRNAQKRSEDVTERVLAAARELGAHGAAPQVAARIPDDVSESAVGDATVPTLGARPGRENESPVGAAGGGEVHEQQLLADSLGLEVLALLDDGAVVPQQVWRLAQMRLSDRSGRPSAGESLALAERAVSSLLERRLVSLGSGDGGAEPIGTQQQATVLAAIETWVGGGSQQVVIARNG